MDGPRVQRDVTSGGGPTRSQPHDLPDFQKVEWETREVRSSTQVTEQSRAGD